MKRRLYLLVACLFVQSTVHACSIVAYLGNQLCKAFLLKGIERLEYRGYDSAGLSLFDLNSDTLKTIKRVGKMDQLYDAAIALPYDGYMGIGHTRWATHGDCTQTNAHPHQNSDGTLTIVHNGIIENHFQMKELLAQKGYQFKTQTDSEVLVHLLDDAFKAGNAPKHAVISTVRQLKGACTFVGMHQDFPDTLFAARQRAPLCIGIADGQTYVASDFLAFADKTSEVYFMPEKSVAIITPAQIAVYAYDGTQLPLETKMVHLQPSAYEKPDHKHFMLKEIYEQKVAIERTIDHYRSLGDSVWEQLGLQPQEARELAQVNLFGCGTSWHAARIGQFFFETIAKIPAAVHLASEFRHMPFFATDKSLFLAISQSGETADTLELMRYFRQHNARLAVLTNVETSSMVRESDGALLTKAGPEIAVASTKAFSTQLTGLYWLAHRVALQKGVIDEAGMAQAERDLLHAASVLEQAIETYSLEIIEDAKVYAHHQRVMYLGRHVTYPFAMEGALKLKEISYIFAQGYPAGELKHGSIALIDEHTPVILFSHQDPVIYRKLVGNAQEAKARKGHIVAFAFEGQDELIALADKVYIIPRVAPLLEPLAMTGIMQYFAYQIALVLGRDIDKPRNLAKAVTVQ